MILSALTALAGISCSGQKENKMNLENWLEDQAPGKYVVINDIVDLDLKNLYTKKKQTVIGLKDDPEVQIKVTWFKNDTASGLDAAKISEELEEAQQDMMVARKIVQQFKDHGIEKMAIGVMTPAFYFLPYGEPTPEERDKQLSGILALLQKQEFSDYTSIWIQYMEDSVYQEEFKDVIPNGYWYRGDSYHEQHKIMSHNFEWRPDLTVEILSDGWEFNSGSNRAMVYLDDAYQKVSDWADKNLAKPYHLEGDNLVQYESDSEDPLAIHFSFPYFEEKINMDNIEANTLIKGYVTGKFHADKKTFTEIRETKAE